MKTKSPTVLIETYNVHTASEAFTRLESTLLAIPATEILPRVVDSQAVVAVVLNIAAFIAAPDVRARFATLPTAEFDVVHVDRLGASAWATWHAASEWMSAVARSTDARLPPSLLQDATETRERMLRVADYYIDDPVEIASIRSGSGHLDLASDLTRLARLYGLHAEVIRSDRKHYRAGDAELAQKLSADIIHRVGQPRTQSERHWAEMHDRAWTLLMRDYEEVRAAGRWLFRRDNPEGRFPSLVTSVRARRTRRTDPPAAPADAPPTSPAVALASSPNSST